MAKFGFGVGYGGVLGGFKAQERCDLMGQFVKLPHRFDVGGSLRFQCEIDFQVVKASATAECALGYRQVKCNFKANSTFGLTTELNSPRLLN